MLMFCFTNILIPTKPIAVRLIGLLSLKRYQPKVLMKIVVSQFSYKNQVVRSISET